MRAAFIETLGGPENIRYGELPTPRPGPTDVLVDVTSTTVNPVDTFVRSGLFRTPLPFPFVIGRDLVGTVAATGPGTAGFAVGDRVWTNSLGHGGRQGAAAEQAVVPADRLYHLPPGVRPEDAVAVVHPGATAYLGLFTHGRLRAGETVLVAGAAGNVGSALVTLAVEAGARVVATASARDLDHCRALGAAEALDYRDPELAERLTRACPGGVDLHLDTSGENDLAAAVDLLAPRGRIVLLAGARSRPVLPVGPLYMKDCSIAGFVISHATGTELAEAAATLNRLLAAGRLRPRAVETLPLSAAAEVHGRMERGELHGTRVVLRP
ncbi:NADPH:quinone reductase [Streptomyces rubellomurinus]|uniref:Oxidoreductase n=1 Tax=Streptomyces rubellomurinus (strain ATCC 31215) TaxID=359131 RepID=A0A0F2TK75_STRR3|nr:NADPH:quinone reductase [Streptomyces rubellomurinus]KJS62117.1 oxidoreductase [Streptomyces rubellomurinus]